MDTEAEARIRAELEAEWSNLACTNYEVTSSHTAKYNCFAWAIYEDDRWWSPLPQDDYYWPEGVPREETLEAFIKVYQLYGFEVCDNGSLESGCEKIALYLKDGKPKHIARQKNDAWTSKLGRYEDITHELDGLQGEQYGVAQKFMKRQL